MTSKGGDGDEDEDEDETMKQMRNTEKIRKTETMGKWRYGDKHTE